MIRTIEINGFKKFEHIQIENLAQVNLFVGMNNAGKTTLLEAVYGLACGNSIIAFFSKTVLGRIMGHMTQSITPYKMVEAIMNCFHKEDGKQNLSFSFHVETDDDSFHITHELTPGDLFREFSSNQGGSFNSAEYLSAMSPSTTPVQGNGFHQPNYQLPLGLWKTTENGTDYQCLINFPNVSNDTQQNKVLFLAYYSGLFAYHEEQDNKKIYSHLLRKNLLEEFITEMNLSFNGLKIKNIENIPYPDGTEGFISVLMEGGERIPLYGMGDGVRRWYDIVGKLVYFPDAIHCFEEVDNGLHYAAQEQLSRNLLHYAEKYNNQLFMTTHNLEYMDALLQAARKRGEDCLQQQIRIITLRHDDRGVTHRVMDGEEALWARERGLELRI